MCKNAFLSSIILFRPAGNEQKRERNFLWLQTSLSKANSFFVIVILLYSIINLNDLWHGALKVLNLSWLKASLLQLLTAALKASI